MDYSFVRKIVKNISKESANRIYQSLIANGIEVFVESNKEYFNVTEEHLLEHSDLYVSAADVDFARTLVEEIGLGQYLCSELEANVNVEKSEVEKAEEEFYRKHKQNQLFAWVIIAGVLVLMIFQFLNNLFTLY